MSTNFAEWTEVDNQVYTQLPYRVAEWVAEFGSLTEKLATHVEQVKIDLLKQEPTILSQEEANALAIDVEKLLTREVILYGPAKPWIFAKTLLSPQAEYLIASLGSQPLGSILFSGTHLRRYQLQLKKLRHGDALFEAAKNHCKKIEESLWARRSLWVSSDNNKDIKILVSEVFLPDSPLY